MIKTSESNGQIASHWSIFRLGSYFLYHPPKRWVIEKNMMRVTCHATRKLPFGAIEAAQWLTTRPVEAGFCMYLADRPTKLPPTNQNFSSIFRLSYYNPNKSAHQLQGCARFAHFLPFVLERWVFFALSVMQCQRRLQTIRIKLGDISPFIQILQSLHIHFWWMALFVFDFIESFCYVNSGVDGPSPKNTLKSKVDKLWRSLDHPTPIKQFGRHIWPRV